MDSATEAIDPALMRAKARVGRTLRGKWHLDVLLGVGGMAAVYAATHRNRTRAAIKVLHPDLTAHSHVRARFFREGRIANTVPHEGAVKVLDEDEDENGSVFLVMELLDGESLDSRAARSGGRLPVEEVLAIADQLLDVLVAAHDKGVVHRDLKPENVFLTRDGQVRVLDFGIARLREISSQSNATRDGSMMGTPAYMSPEQARGLWEEVDARADLWAVGATMFSLITGRPVHEGRTTNEVLVHAVTKRAMPLAEALPGVPDSVAGLIDKALAFEKADRWADAQTMQNALREAFHSMHGSPLSSHPKPSVPETVPNRTLPSAGMEFPETLVSAGTTGAAVASGRTGVPLRVLTLAGVPRFALFAGGAVATITLLLLVALGISAVASRGTGDAATATVETALAQGPATSQEATVANAVENKDGGSMDKVTPAASSPVIVSVDDLPSAAPPGKPSVGVRPPPLKPAPKLPATSWKEQRQ